MTKKTKRHAQAFVARVSVIVQGIAFFTGLAGAIGLVANGLYLHAVAWVAVVIGVFAVGSRVDEHLYRTTLDDVVREVDDPVLGRLVFDPEDTTWVASIERGGKQLGFRIAGGNRPSGKLIEQARRLAEDTEGVHAKIATFVEREAPTMDNYADAARLLTIDSIALYDPRRPSYGLVYFHNAERDPQGLAFRCEWVDGEPRSLVVDT